MQLVETAPTIRTLITLALVLPCIFGDDAPVIELPEGKVKGEVKDSRDDKDFFAYRGIPYARAPVGDLRFEAPQPPSNWSGVKDADDYEKECLQFDFFAKKVKGEEDCLYLNVFTPRYGDGNGISKKLLPVMVYIHGGFFMSGSANHYKPNYFLDHEVVVVTFNYRVGALGFLNTQDGVVRGNMGLKDQVMALRWVQKNIRKFGGDSNRVTLFGEGAGASSVHYHMLSPMSRGLFYRAISQSGTALNPYAFQPRPAEAAIRLALILKCGNTLNNTADDYLTNSTILVQCLRKVSAKKIADVHKETWNPLRDPLSTFLPSVEANSFEVNDTFLSEHPFSMLIREKQRRVPWMVGFNADEGLHVTAKISSDKELLEKVEGQWNGYAGKLLIYDNTRADVADAIRKYYLDSPDVPAVSQQPVVLTAAPSPSPGHHVNGPPSLYPPLPPLSPGLNDTRAQTQPTLIHPSPSQPVPSMAHPTLQYPPAYSWDNVENRALNFEEKFTQFTRLFTDRLFAAAVLKSVQLQSRLSPVYMYYNSYKGQYSFVDFYAGKEKEPVPAMKKVSTWFKTKLLGRTAQQPRHLGVCHGDELPLLFKYSEAKVKEKTKDYPASKDLVQLWFQFASTTEPHLRFRNITWSPVDPNQVDINGVLQFSNENNDVKLLHGFYRETQDFWHSIPYFAPFQL